MRSRSLDGKTDSQTSRNIYRDYHGYKQKCPEYRYPDNQPRALPQSDSVQEEEQRHGLNLVQAIAYDSHGSAVLLGETS
jgi:hypothetical protein